MRFNISVYLVLGLGSTSVVYALPLTDVPVSNMDTITSGNGAVVPRESPTLPSLDKSVDIAYTFSSNTGPVVQAVTDKAKRLAKELIQAHAGHEYTVRAVPTNEFHGSMQDLEKGVRFTVEETPATFKRLDPSQSWNCPCDAVVHPNTYSRGRILGDWAPVEAKEGKGGVNRVNYASKG
ncbi:hypothetical protein C8J55DRAFT_523385 [Lentinula edodes]|uniref:Uncharacterized protein n=1 Tax=Lentinula lateritia TaxID=40482 RepID=A0A9W9DHH3_9AGAR|nr:hypothetical protein C8J55DRAFT_523385 [Lentinula edodes]